MEGRKEKRTPESTSVIVSSGLLPVVAEFASTENVSSHGIRLRTDRPWKQGTRVLLQPSQGGPWMPARVVYCRTLQSKTFAVGLEFLPSASDSMA